ncbi:MAG TPA: ribose-5-phosphate isomerase RpiA [Polyangiaceae bacterium]
MSLEEMKRRAALAALAYVPEHGVVGLGTGSTVRFFVEAVGERVRAGARLHGVATSNASSELARRSGIPLLDETGPWDIDVCVDGADEVSAALDLIKGGGGAHTREKLVNEAARLNVIVVDDRKLSEKLGERSAVPVEVLPFAHAQTAAKLSGFGKASLRHAGTEPFRTDSGNFIYDLETGRIDEPAVLDRALKALAGVVETGLFCGRADFVLVATGDGVTRLPAPETSATLGR